MTSEEAHMKPTGKGLKMQCPLLGLFASVVLAVPVAASTDPNTLKDLDDCLRYAALHNAGLQARFEAFKAAVEAVPQAQALPDPRFEYRYFIEHVETRVGPQEHSFGFMQTFPWFGKIAARTDAAAAAAKAAHKRYEAERLKLFYEVRSAYYEYAYLHRAVRLAEQNVELVEHFEEVARARFAAAAGSHPDVLQAQIEVDILLDRLARVREMLKPQRARLNRVMNRSSTAAVPPPGPLEYQPVAVSTEQLLARLRMANPQLTALDHELDAARNRIALAEKRTYPDVTLGLGWIDTGRSSMPVHDSGKDPVIATLSVNLPIWADSYNAGKRQAQAAARQVRLERIQQENDLATRALEVLFGLEDAERRVRLYRESLVPKARQMVQVAEDSYRTGAVDFSTLIEAQRSLLRFELEDERAQADHLQRLAELEMLAGGPLKP